MSNAGSDFEFAVSAYRESRELSSLSFQQPIEAYSKRVDNVVYPRTSATGYVARYDIRRRRMLI